MICKSQCSFSPQSSTKKEKDCRETFYAYKQLFSRGHVWHIETVVLCDFYITVSRSFRCQIRRYEKRKRAKSWNICLGSPFFFIYWNINVFASGQVCLCMLFGALTEMPTDAPSLIFFHCGCICLSRDRQSPYHPPRSPAPSALACVPLSPGPIPLLHLPLLDSSDSAVLTRCVRHFKGWLCRLLVCLQLTVVEFA